MKKPDPKTASKHEVQEYLKYLLAKQQVFKDARFHIKFINKELLNDNVDMSK